MPKRRKNRHDNIQEAKVMDFRAEAGPEKIKKSIDRG